MKGGLMSRSSLTGRDDRLVVERISDTATFAGMREEWNELLEGSAASCLFLTWEWLFTWWHHLSAGRTLSIITVRRAGRLIALLPAAVNPPSARRLVPWPTLEFLGTGVAGSDYLDVIVRRGHEREALSAMAEAIEADPRVVELTHVPATGSHAADLAAALGQRRWVTMRRRINVCPVVPLRGLTWRDYLESLGAAHRYNVQRRLKNLSKQFTVRCEPCRTEAERRQAMEILVELHNRRWRARGGSEAFATAGRRAFYDDVSRLALERGWLRLFVLWLDGRPAAALHGYRYGDTFSFYQAGFEPDFARQSVGLVIMGLTIKSALEEGVGEYDMLHGDETYKFLWARQTRDLDRIELFPPSLRGRLSRLALHVSRRARRTTRRILGDGIADRLVRS